MISSQSHRHWWARWNKSFVHFSPLLSWKLRKLRLGPWDRIVFCDRDEELKKSPHPFMPVLAVAHGLATVHPEVIRNTGSSGYIGLPDFILLFFHRSLHATLSRALNERLMCSIVCRCCCCCFFPCSVLEGLCCRFWTLCTDVTYSFHFYSSFAVTRSATHFFYVLNSK